MAYTYTRSADGVILVSDGSYTFGISQAELRAALDPTSEQFARAAVIAALAADATRTRSLDEQATRLGTLDPIGAAKATLDGSRTR
jgi:hypothetical protein